VVPVSPELLAEARAALAAWDQFTTRSPRGNALWFWQRGSHADELAGALRRILHDLPAAGGAS
jgi:hypothetical protein